MYENLKIKFVQDMVNNGIIEKEDTELYCFGIDALKTYIGAVIMTLGIGILFGSFWESLIFFISFKLLRAEAGGYHADSRKRCNLISITMLICTLAIISVYATKISFAVLLICLICSVIVVFIFAPLPHNNKPITDTERVYHKRRARLFVLVESLVAMLLYSKFRDFSITVMMAEIDISLSLIAWLLFRKIRND